MRLAALKTTTNLTVFVFFFFWCSKSKSELQIVINTVRYLTVNGKIVVWAA